MSGRYAARVVIITGGSKGIGEGCVRVFFREGAHGLSSSDPAEILSVGLSTGKGLADSLATGAGTVTFVRADVNKAADLQHLVDTTVAKFGRIDCLINNAGWHPNPGSIDDFTADDLESLFHLNVTSAFVMCKLCLPHLRKVQGNIINMSSLVGSLGQAQAVTYSATKGALIAFTKSLAIDEAKHNVRVNVVSPGNIWTPLWKSWAEGEANFEQAVDSGDQVQVMRRKGTIQECGELCLFLAAEATFTTGVDHIISGGAEIGYGKK
eukprot:m.249661 g.249661  ORF g.249661 m.249661 type:complete len:266 (-) comp54501_c0_seq4:45-842(-)